MWLTPPLAATTPMPPRGTLWAPGTKLAMRSRPGAKYPEVFGPMRRMPLPASSARTRSSIATPAGPVSEKPPEQTRAARTPTVAHSASAPAVALAGTQTTARSGAPPAAAIRSAASEAETAKPSAPARGFTRASGMPLLSREAAITAPSFSGDVEAPITIAPRGSKKARIGCAVTWRSPHPRGPRARASRPDPVCRRRSRRAPAASRRARGARPRRSVPPRRRR